jgi:hypothetical protein
VRAGVRSAVLAVMGLMVCGLGAGAEPPAYPSATPLKHNSLKACNQLADAKKLSGTARTRFVQHCQTETVTAPAPITAAGPATPAAR